MSDRKDPISQIEDEQVMRHLGRYLATYYAKHSLKRAFLEAMKPTPLPERPDTYSIRFIDVSETEKDIDNNALGTST